jgi:hypothetical protein
VQFSLQTLMASMALWTLFFWLFLTAFRVGHDLPGQTIHHLWQDHLWQGGASRPPGPGPSALMATGDFVVTTHPLTGFAGFWPRYWRRLLGQPWPGSFRCPDCPWEKDERFFGRKLIASSADGVWLRDWAVSRNTQRARAAFEALPVQIGGP